jgi:hypothetical protein
MLRILRAFAWMRWRMLVNSFEQTGSRDVLERFSIAAEKLGPILATLFLVPSALVLAALGVAAGYTLGSGEPDSILLTAARYMLVFVPVLAIVGPLVLPAADRANPVRLLLLPIPPSTLYIAQSSVAFGDIWNLLMLPLVLGLPIGLAAAGALLPALALFLGSILLVLVVVGIASVATSLLAIIVRDRRRGELLALLFIIVLPVVSMLPGLLSAPRRNRDEPRETSAPVWVAQVAARAATIYPSEMYFRVARGSVGGDAAGATAALAGLAAATVLLHGTGLLLFRRLLQQPGTTGPRRRASGGVTWGRTVPGLSPGASAVAMAHLRLALRTPRGRSILLSPLAMLALFGVLIYRGGGTMDFGSFELQGGISLATFTTFIALMSILPIAMNQFAVDKAGLTLALLSPLTDVEYLRGKAVGNALIAAPPTLVSFFVAALLFPGGAWHLWVALFFALPAIYFVTAPIAAICSAVFPRAVDMNSIGRGSNAHGAAGFLGLFAFLGAAVPPILLTLLATKLLDRPALVPVLMLAWCATAYVIGRLLFVPARRIFEARRENLGLVV